MRIAVFTGSSPGSSPRFAEEAARLGEALARRDIGIVYGGGRVGLMGVVADAALRAGGEVIGVIPQDLADREVAHEGLTRLEVVDSMHTRKARMAGQADAFVALPGGIGTLEEFFEVWTWLQLGLHERPVCLYDVDGFWDPLRALVEQMASSGFLQPSAADSLVTADSPESLLTAIDGWVPPPRRGLTPPAP